MRIRIQKLRQISTTMECLVLTYKLALEGKNGHTIMYTLYVLGIPAGGDQCPIDPEAAQPGVEIVRHRGNQLL